MDGPRNAGGGGPGREPAVTVFRRGSDCGRDPMVLRRSSVCGREPRGSWQGGSPRSSVSDRGAGEVTTLTNGCCDGEEQKQKSEKCMHSNGLGHTVLHQEKHAMLTAEAPVGASVLTGSTDAEC
ncbi:hypothetical protein JZ751_022183 [Albula glossodonta]|uniref:Uncharacterized protein n=1 Tax=Albula glossodonta TaxID=121402 RepID=A0A8T2MRM6_9TELE|nr:hypothetical protein JZ751_022183 [Albula glossodonta]